MKKTLNTILVILLVLLTLAGCGSKEKQITIAIPNDTSNEARALLLLEAKGFIEVDDKAGIKATINDITSNPHNIKFNEVEAAQIPNILKDVDFAIINTNYAIAAGLNPAQDALAQEGAGSAYANILAVREGRENDPLVLALVAALESQQVADYITKTYAKSVVSTVENPTDGYNAALNYDALNGQTITVAASPTPHAEILTVAKEILAAKGINLVIQEYTDYVIPNNVVEDGTLDANYFQHVPYLDDFNKENGTHLVSVAAIHVEPLGIYGGKQSSLDVIGK